MQKETRSVILFYYMNQVVNETGRSENKSSVFMKLHTLPSALPLCKGSALTRYFAPVTPAAAPSNIFWFIFSTAALASSAAKCTYRDTMFDFQPPIVFNYRSVGPSRASEAARTRPARIKPASSPSFGAKPPGDARPGFWRREACERAPMARSAPPPRLRWACKQRP